MLRKHKCISSCNLVCIDWNEEEKNDWPPSIVLILYLCTLSFSKELVYPVERFVFWHHLWFTRISFKFMCEFRQTNHFNEINCSKIHLTGIGNDFIHIFIAIVHRSETELIVLRFFFSKFSLADCAKCVEINF